MPSANTKLVEHLRQTDVLNTPNLADAFMRIDRSDFTPRNQQSRAYEDIPLPIGHGQTISQPLTVAMMLEWLSPQPGNNCLEIGSGSGYVTALLAATVGEQGSITGLEIIPELVEWSKQRLQAYKFPHARIEQATPGTLGKPGQTFDRILVSASASAFPEELLNQLASPGRVVIPVENDVIVYKKDADGTVTRNVHTGFVFVPLV